MAEKGHHLRVAVQAFEFGDSEVVIGDYFLVRQYHTRLHPLVDFFQAPARTGVRVHPKHPTFPVDELVVDVYDVVGRIRFPVRAWFYHIVGRRPRDAAEELSHTPSPPVPAALFYIHGGVIIRLDAVVHVANDVCFEPREEMEGICRTAGCYSITAAVWLLGFAQNVPGSDAAPFYVLGKELSLHGVRLEPIYSPYYGL